MIFFLSTNCKIFKIMRGRAELTANRAYIYAQHCSSSREREYLCGCEQQHMVCCFINCQNTIPIKSHENFVIFQKKKKQLCTGSWHWHCHGSSSGREATAERQRQRQSDSAAAAGRANKTHG